MYVMLELLIQNRGIHIITIQIVQSPRDLLCHVTAPQTDTRGAYFGGSPRCVSEQLLTRLRVLRKHFLVGVKKEARVS